MPAPAAETYLRCEHCNGFYETSFARCKWCDYNVPVEDDAGRPRVFPDRDACRALQLAEYHRLPPEAHADPMGPPKEDPTLLCNCLHCGPDGHLFEAVEMRWMANEQMWACPCTTCGGRGFGIDIHSAENKWQCDDCGHFYLPPDRDYHADNALCPRCGSTHASGWFDDDDDDRDDNEDDFADDDFDDHPTARELDGADGDDDDDLDDLFTIDDDDEDDRDDNPYDLGITWKESDAEDDFSSSLDEPDRPYPRADRLPDDIDFPHPRDRRNPGFNEDDDIPF